MKRNKQFYQEKEYRRFRTREAWCALDYDERHNFEVEEYEIEEYLVVPNKNLVPINEMDIYEELSKKIIFLPYRNCYSTPEDYKNWNSSRRYSRWANDLFTKTTPNYKQIENRTLNGLNLMGYKYSIDLDLDKLDSKKRKIYDKYLRKENTSFSWEEPKYKTELIDNRRFIVEKTIVKKINKYYTGEKPGLLHERMGGEYEWHKYFKESNKHYGRDIDWCWTYSKHQPDFKSKKHNKSADNKWLRTDVDFDEWDKHEPYWRQLEEEYNNQNDNLYADWLEYKHEQDNIQFDDSICKWGFIY